MEKHTLAFFNEVKLLRHRELSMKIFIGDLVILSAFSLYLR